MLGAGREHPEQTFHGLTGVYTAIYSVLLPRMAAKIPVEPWKARPGMHASLCHKLRPGALRTSYFRTTEPNKICRFRCTSQGSATSHPKLTLASIVTMIQFTTNLIWFFTVAAYQYKLKYHHLHTAHDHLQN